MNSPSVTRSRLRVSGALSVAAVLLGSVVAIAGAALPSSAATVDYLITPTGFDFGDVPLNNPSPAQQVRVTNISGATIRPILTGGNAGVFGVTDHCSRLKLPAGASCTLSYQFDPNGLGPRAATISPSLNGQTFSLSFTGNGINPFLITPTSLDFGYVKDYGQSSTQTVTITNVGTVIEPTDTTDTTVSGSGAFGEMTDCTAALAPGAICHLNFRFQPGTLGAQSAIVSGVLDSQPYAISLKGDSYKPNLKLSSFSVTPTSLDFGDVPVDSPAVPGEQPVTFTNLTSATITPGSLSLTGSFGVYAGCTSALAPGASCTDNFVFGSSVLGRFSGTASGTWGGHAFSISLTGNANNQFLITPTRFDFGSVPDGSLSAPQDVVITNVGRSGTSLFGSPTAPSDNFPEITSCQNVMLMAGETCKLGYEFAPGGPDPYEYNVISSVNLQQYHLAFSGVSTPVKPVVTGISPATGPTAGGTVVTVTGYGFTGVTQVLFGSTPGTNVTSDSDGQLNVTAPAHTSGSYDVHVVTALGTSSAVTADRYTYVPPAPVVTSISPSSGPIAGGTSVTITGSGFTGATKVLFGTVPARSFTVVSATKITAVSPAEAAGLHNVSVTTPGGVSATVAADGFTSLAAPVVSSVSPASGPAAGGTAVTITGSGFTGTTTVVFGSVAARSFTVVSATKITAVSAAEAVGVKDVHVTTPGGVSATVTADHFTFH